MEFVKNQHIEIEITGMSADGNGIGRVSGMAVFVPKTAVGDIAKVQIVKVCKNYLVGKAIEFLRLSDQRLKLDCKAAVDCGGCAFRHISYESECKIKYDRVADCMRRIGGVDTKPEAVLAAANTEGYRNKAQMPVGRDQDGNLKIGFYAPRSHRIADCRDCRLQPAEFKTIIRIFAAYIQKYNVSVYEESTGRGLVRHLYLRKAFGTGQIMVCVVINGQALPKSSALVETLTHEISDISGILININRKPTNVVLGSEYKVLYGNDKLEDELCGTKFLLSPASFYQVNHAQATRLFEKVVELADPGEQDIVLDLYCGIGAIGLVIAGKRKFKKLIGVEVVPEAVEDAKRNARNNGIQNTEFLCNDALEAAKLLARRGERPDIVVVDPPRKGCDKELIEIITKRMIPRKVVYVSCDPATLARDIAEFRKLGYRLERAVPVDMFPRTPHVETAALILRDEKV